MLLWIPLCFVYSDKSSHDKSRFLYYLGIQYILPSGPNPNSFIYTSTKKCSQTKATFPLALSIRATTNWSCICWRLFLKTVVLSKEVTVWWFFVFCTLRIVILLYSSSITLIFHSNKTASGITCFWLHVKIKFLIPLMFCFTWAKSISLVLDIFRL